MVIIVKIIKDGAVGRVNFSFGQVGISRGCINAFVPGQVLCQQQILSACGPGNKVVPEGVRGDRTPGFIA